MSGYPNCTLCKGTGVVTVDWGDAPCPECRLRARMDVTRQRAASDQAEKKREAAHAAD